MGCPVCVLVALSQTAGELCGWLQVEVSAGRWSCGGGDGPIEELRPVSEFVSCRINMLVPVRLLRPNVPKGIHVWRDEPGGPIVAAAAVWDTGFEWCGREGRTPPADFAELASRPGRELFFVYDDEKTEWGGLPRAAFLEAIVSAGLTEPGRLVRFGFPTGNTVSIPSVEPMNLDRQDARCFGPAWDDPSIFPANEPARIAKYRRHQSWYRECVLQVGPGKFMSYEHLGSYLDAGLVVSNPSLNFLTAEAAAHAVERAAAVKKEGGALDPVRLRQNLLSSMPLCFNLFGSLRGEPAFLTLFQRVFDPAATRIVDVCCEYAPQPPVAYLADRTAFDAVVFYETADGPRFMGIETKYTEPFSAKEYDSERYDAVTEMSGWFKDGQAAPSVLRGRKSNQLWRNLMLAASLELAGGHGHGSVAVVALEDDPGATKAISILREHLAAQNRLVWAPINALLDAADGIAELAEWSLAFRLRYVP